MNARRKSDDARPQVIDLSPEDIVAETPADPRMSDASADSAEPARQEQPNPAEAAPPSARPRKNGLGLALPLTTLLLGAIAGGWFYRDVLASYFPGNEVAALEARLAAMEVNNQSSQSQLAAATASIDQVKSDLAGLKAGLGNLATASDAQKADAVGIAGRIGSTEAAITDLQGRLDQLKSAMAAAPAAPGSSTPAEQLNPLLLQRIDALEKDVAALKAAKSGTTNTAALSQDLSDLKAKVAAGAPFRDELTRITAMVPAANGLDVLSNHADQGLADAAALARELTAIATTLPRAADPATSGQQGAWDWFTGLFGNLVTVRDLHAADWPVLALDAARFAEAGDLAKAVDVIDAAQGEKPAAISDWRNRAAQRLKLEAAMEEAADAVMRHLAAKG